MFTDSHTHLYLKKFQHDIDDVINNALENKVTKFLMPNIDNTTLKKMLSLCKKDKRKLFPMIGLHPCSVEKDYLEQLEKLYNKINDYNFIGIGEVGMDLYWTKQFIVEQKNAFRIQINWAKKHNLPLVIHSRNAFNDIYNILLEEKTPHMKGVFHCFSGNYEEAKKIIDMGFYLGIGGVLTFKNSNLSDVIKKIDMKNVILETDSPYLAPHPMRGERNEPKFLPLIGKQLAKIKNMSISEIAQITNQNINTIFFNN